MPSNLSLHDCFLFQPHTDCPQCSHPYMQGFYTNEALAKMEKESKEKQAAANLSTDLEEGTVTNTRCHVPVQKWKCPCYLLSGVNCPECKGENRDSCAVCKCKCAAGPAKESQFQNISAAAQSKIFNVETHQPLLSAADKRGAFGQVVRDVLESAEQHCRLNGVETTGATGQSNVMGTAAHLFAGVELEGNVTAQLGHDAGAPTDTFSDGVGIQKIQECPKSSRYYRNGLGNASHAEQRRRELDAKRVNQSTTTTAIPPTNNSVNPTETSPNSASAAASTNNAANTTTPALVSLEEYKDLIVLDAVKLMNDEDLKTGNGIIQLIYHDVVAQGVIEAHYRQRKSLEDIIHTLKLLLQCKS